MSNMLSYFHGEKVCFCNPGEEDIRDDVRNGCSTCQRCGKVVEENFIDVDHEAIRSFQDGDDHSLTLRENQFGPTTTLEMEFNPKQSEENTEMLQKISQLNKEANADKKVKEKKASVKKFCAKFQTSPRITDLAIKIVQEYEAKRKKFSRADKDVLPISAIYLAYKYSGASRSLDELVSNDKVLKKKVAGMIKKLQNAELDAFNIEDRDDINPNKTSENDIIKRACNKLKVKWADERKIIEVAKKCGDYLTGKQPKTIAASSLMFYINEMKSIHANPLQINSSDIARECGVDNSTLRNSYNILTANKNSIIEIASELA